MRRNREPPNSASRSLIARVNEGWETWLSFAAREVQLLADRKEVSDLMDFHARQTRYFEFSVVIADHVSSVPDWIRDRQRSTISAAGSS